MKKKNSSSTAFLVVLFATVVILAFGALHFLSEMNSKYVLIQNGMTPKAHVLDHYKYQSNKKGLIFSLTFMVSGLCFMIMILLPSEREVPVHRRSDVPQPVHPAEGESSISAVVEADSAQAIPEKASSEEQSTYMEDRMAPKGKEEAIPEDDLIAELEEIVEEEIDDYESRVMEGDDDVVYGTGPITYRGIMDFVHRFPDSALKFLFRKQLDGKMLSSAEEDIYESWEKRGMSRGKVKAYIYNLMSWKAFPKRPLYEIWKLLRDHIFDNVNLD